MMKLTSKGRYATRLMLDLAQYYGQGPVLLKEVARRQEISQKYLGQLVAPLKTAGLVNASRGAHGGYALAKAAQDITLAQIIQAVEGEPAIAECVQAPKICNRVATCVTRDIWSQLNQKMNEVLESFTLSDMLKKQKEKIQAQSLAYSI